MLAKTSKDFEVHDPFHIGNLWVHYLLNKIISFCWGLVNKFELDVISGGGGYGTFIFTTNFVALVTPEVVTSSSVYILNSISNRLAQLWTSAAFSYVLNIYLFNIYLVFVISSLYKKKKMTRYKGQYKQCKLLSAERSSGQKWTSWKMLQILHMGAHCLGVLNNVLYFFGWSLLCFWDILFTKKPLGFSWQHLQKFICWTVKKNRLLIECEVNNNINLLEI